MRVIFHLLIAAALVGLSAPPADTQPSARAKYAKQQRVGDLKIGDEAPDFKLESADGRKTVQLSSFEGKRDVVLIFGSYT